MKTEILTAIIPCCTAIVSGLLSAVLSSKLTSYRLERLEQKAEKNDGLAERIARLEERIKVSDFCIAAPGRKSR